MVKFSPHPISGKIYDKTATFYLLAYCAAKKKKNALGVAEARNRRFWRVFSLAPVADEIKMNGFCTTFAPVTQYCAWHKYDRATTAHVIVTHPAVLFCFVSNSNWSWVCVLLIRFGAVFNE